MRSRPLWAVLGLVLLLAPPSGADAASPHGPSGQQAQCAADGGSFAVGYEADTYVCVSGKGRSVTTCRYDATDRKCSTEEGPGEKRTRPAAALVLGFRLF
jgi:hypothetical protein